MSARILARSAVAAAAIVLVASTAAAQSGEPGADAGAQAVAAPPPEAPPVAEGSAQVAAPEPSVNEAELAAMLAEQPQIEADTPSIQLYGFADVSVGRPYLDDKNPFGVAANRSAFAVGNVNLYLASNLTHGFSSLIEVRFTYMPAGTSDPTGKVLTTYATDPSSYGRQDRWGGIILQRVHLDYSFHALLNVRVGQFLTPYGIWNVDHGSPTVISTTRPYPIGNGYFPERQTGMELFGSYLVGNVTLGYHLTLSNGRGDIDTSDFDKNKALGGRLFVATDAIGALKVGVSAYGGRATQNVSFGGGLNADGDLELELSTANQFDEFAVAGDLLWEWKNLRLQAEGIVSQVRYTDDGRRVRTTTVGGPVGLVADHVARAWYGLVGYRLPWLGIMPYVLIDYFRHAPGSGPAGAFEIGSSATGYNFGLNVRPIPSVVLKLQVSLVHAPEVAYSDTTLVVGQAAWAF